MIRNTFCMLDGVGEKTERRLWSYGILTWDDFLRAESVSGLSGERKRLYDQSLFQTSQALAALDAGYLGAAVKRREQWRLFPDFRDLAVCLDIETNGLHAGAGGYVTVVWLYDGHDYRCFVRGRNLTAENLGRELGRYKYLITFYGAGFDIPFLLRSFRGLSFGQPHMDLCFGMQRLGMRGGLKRLESELGIRRDEATTGLNGYDAVRLWGYAERGSSEAMDLLIAYNREDTVNLMVIASILYERLRRLTGIEEYLACGVA